MTEAITENQVSDEDLDKSINDLTSKETRSEEEETQLKDAKTEKHGRFQKRFDKITWEKKTAQEENEKLKAEIEGLKKPADAPKAPIIDKKTVAIGNQEYFTDETLTAMVKNGEITNDKAFSYQTERQEAAITQKVLGKISKTEKENTETEQRTTDMQKVLKEYPHFAKNHPDHNENDPLYLEATEIYQNGYNTKPNGLSLAVQKAKKVLRIDDKKPDLSDEFNLRGPSAPGAIPKDAPVELSTYEEDAAERTYRDIINPVTGRGYTRSEAIIKAKNAKKARRK